MTIKNICVLISGGGSNLAAIIAAVVAGKLPARLCRVIADRDCAGLNHARQVGVPCEVIPRGASDFAARLQTAIPADSDLIVLAGFLSILPAEVIAKFPLKIINLHPSLLPKFGGAGMYGANVHQAVLAAGETESGCTVHFVDTGIDTGEIIAQVRVPVQPDDSPTTLQQRIQAQEHILLVDTIARLLQPFQPTPALLALRAAIDQLDEQIAALLCQRLALIQQAAAEKPRFEDVRLPERVEEKLRHILPVARQHGIDEAYLDLIFRLLIDESIRREQQQWQQNHQGEAK